MQFVLRLKLWRCRVKNKNRMSYNLSAISFSPQGIADEIKNIYQLFEITYQPDYRQAIG